MTLTGRSCALPKPRWVYLSPLSLLLPFSCIALIKWKCFWVSVCIELKSFQCLFSLFVSISLLPSLQSPAHSCRVSCFQRQQIAPRWPLSHFLLLFFFFFNLLTHSFAVWLPFFSHFTLSISPLSLFHMNPLSPVPDIASYCVLLCAPLCLVHLVLHTYLWAYVCNFSYGALCLLVHGCSSHLCGLELWIW